MITAKKTVSFSQWIGLKSIKKDKRKTALLWSLVVEICFLLLSVYLLYIVKDIGTTATSEFSGLGVNALPSILIYALFNTALPEEILFRGFLLKRISSKAGFAIGNIIQAVLFGLLHGGMFISYVGIVKAIIIILFTGCIAWFMGYVNELKANGSILPSWLIHAVANIFSGISSAFLLI
jgi:membrane protease YdiL (CAAX protease family)